MRKESKSKRIGLDAVGHPLMNTAGLWSVRGGAPIERHAFPVYEVNYVHSGNLIWVLDGEKEISVHGGNVLILQPNTLLTPA